MRENVTVGGNLFIFDKIFNFQFYGKTYFSFQKLINFGFKQ